MLLNNLTKKACVIGLCMGMAASPLAFATDSILPTQARFDTGGPALDGTREGIHQSHYKEGDSQSVEGLGNDYRTTFVVGSPELGGTREGMHREQIKDEGDQLMSQQVAQPNHDDTGVGILTYGTRG